MGQGSHAQGLCFRARCLKVAVPTFDMKPYPPTSPLTFTPTSSTHHPHSWWTSVYHKIVPFTTLPHKSVWMESSPPNQACCSPPKWWEWGVVFWLIEAKFQTPVLLPYMDKRFRRSGSIIKVQENLLAWAPRLHNITSYLHTHPQFPGTKKINK